MKRNKRILTVIVMISLCFFFQNLSAQENEKNNADREKEMRLQQLIEEQKKTMAEQKKLQNDELKKSDKVLKDSEKSISNSMDAFKIFRSKVFAPGIDIDELPPATFPGVSIPGFYGFGGGDGGRTTWELSKQVKESTFDRAYTFDIEETANNVVMTVTGDCKSGDIRIKIVMPGGKIYSDIVIDEFGNLNWRKSFTISDDENKDKAGAWTFKINSENATGFFKISLQSY
jgi:hypothetical protein